MTDLLGQVKGADGGDFGIGRHRTDGAEAREPEEDDGMAGFFAKVQEVREKMAAMDAGQRELIRLHDESKVAVQAEKTRQIRQAMTDKTEEIKRQAKSVKNDLDMLDALNARAIGTKGCEDGSAAERTRSSITNSLKKKLADMLHDFTGLRNSIMKQYRDVVDRRYYTVTGNKASEEEIDQLIDTGEAENLFQKAILAQGRGQLLDTLKEINERHEAVKELNKGLLELHQMFLDMSVLVEEQGVKLDNIEKQVGRAVEYVQAGVVQLEQAKQHSKSSRKYLCWALLLFLAVLAAIVLLARPWNWFVSG